MDRLLIFSGIFQAKRKLKACNLKCRYCVVTLWNIFYQVDSRIILKVTSWLFYKVCQQGISRPLYKMIQYPPRSCFVTIIFFILMFSYCNRIKFDINHSNQVRSLLNATIFVQYIQFDANYFGCFWLRCENNGINMISFIRYNMQL